MSSLDLMDALEHNRLGLPLGSEQGSKHGKFENTRQDLRPETLCFPPSRWAFQYFVHDNLTK